MQTETIDFALPAAMTIETVEELQGKLRALVETSGKTVTLDASAVETVTTPGAQLLVALDKHLRGGGGKLLLRNPRASVTETFATLGLRQQMAEWSA